MVVSWHVILTNSWFSISDCFQKYRRGIQGLSIPGEMERCQGELFAANHVCLLRAGYPVQHINTWHALVQRRWTANTLLGVFFWCLGLYHIGCNILNHIWQKTKQDKPVEKKISNNSYTSFPIRQLQAAITLVILLKYFQIIKISKA